MNELGDILSLMGACAAGAAPDVIPKTDVDGLRVSTVDTVDCGLETAILDANGAYPVERYGSHEEAVAGHVRWVEAAETLTEVTELGYGTSIDDEEHPVVRTDEFRA